MNILILSPYPPYPPHGGGAMRIYQLLRGLSARHRVTCLTFAPDAEAERALEPLRALCRVVTVPGPPRRGAAERAWTTLASPLPDMALRNRAPAYAARLRALLATESFDVAQAESIEMAPYAQLTARAGPKRPALVILDQFNAEYVLQQRAARTALRALNLKAGPRGAGLGLAGAIYSAIQWLKLARYERRAMRVCDVAVAVSEEDRQALLRLDPELRVEVVPNGVDSEHFSREALARDGGGLALPEPALIFSGTLDFRPNIDAVTWFAHEVLPLIRTRRPEARLLVVGKRPPAALMRLAADGATMIVGEVPDARPYIAGATVYVVPMRIGGGVRLKLLEALSLEAPVVSTSMGAEGVAGLRDGRECLLADTPAEFAAEVLRLIDDRALAQQLGAAGRTLTRASYDWGAIVPRLEALYRGRN